MVETPITNGTNKIAKGSVIILENIGGRTIFPKFHRNRLQMFMMMLIFMMMMIMFMMMIVLDNADRVYDDGDGDD